MSRQYQDPNHQSGHYQTPYQYPPQQQGQFPHPQPNTHNDRLPSHHAHSSYPEGSLQHPPSGQSYGNRPPSMGTVSASESQHSSASPTQSYFPTPNLSVATHHQHERRSSHGQLPATGSSSDNQRLYAAGAGSDTGGGSNIYSAQPRVQPGPHHGGSYTATAGQSQGWNSAVYDEGHNSRTKAPPYRPAGTSNSICRYPRCGRNVFFDRRVNELREWCGDQHMQAAIMHNVEKPCNTCRVWPRRNGYKYCSVNGCRYSGY